MPEHRSLRGNVDIVVHFRRLTITGNDQWWREFLISFQNGTSLGDRAALVGGVFVPDGKKIAPCQEPYVIRSPSFFRIGQLKGVAFRDFLDNRQQAYYMN